MNKIIKLIKCEKCKLPLGEEHFTVRKSICDDCDAKNVTLRKEKVKIRREKKRLEFRYCKICKQNLNPNLFSINKSYCDDCAIKNIRRKEEIKQLNRQADTKFKICAECKQKKSVPEEIYFAAFVCYNCKEIKKLNKEKKCEYSNHQCNKIILRETFTNKDKNFRTCTTCNKRLSIEYFTGKKFTCNKCENERIKQDEHNKIYRKCQNCNEEKIIGKDISNRSIYCFECRDKKRQERSDFRKINKPTSWERTCSSCGKKVIVYNSRLTVFDCEECSKEKKEFERQKRLKYMNRKKMDYCQICNTYTENGLEKDRNIVCEKCRDKMHEFKASCYRDGNYFKVCRDCSKEFQIGYNSKFWEPLKCEKCTTKNKQKNESIRLQFGYRGFCSDNHRFNSLNELDFDEWLILQDIKHDSQKRLKKTLRHADFYLIDYDLYVEIDGLDRKDNIDWYGKLDVYKNLNLKYIITKPVSIHFIDNPKACFTELDTKVLPLLSQYTKTCY
jgi:hypothetical protein